MIQVYDLNAQVSKLSSSEYCLGGCFALPSQKAPRSVLHSQPFVHIHYLFSTQWRRTVTWYLLGSSVQWSHIDHFGISYRWCGEVQNCRSYWNSYVNSDHALLLWISSFTSLIGWRWKMLTSSDLLLLMILILYIEGGMEKTYFSG